MLEQQDQDQNAKVDENVSDIDVQYAEAVSVPPPTTDDGADLESANEDATLNGEKQIEEEETVSADKAKAIIFSNGGYPLLVFLASTVLMISSASKCSTTNYCGGSHGWAVASSVISMVVSFIFLFLERKENLSGKNRVGITTFLFVWWVFVAAFCTFGSSAPFSTPGNGYFASWGGLLGSLTMLTNEVGKVREQIDRFAKLGLKIGILCVGSLVVLFSGVAECSNGCSGYDGYAIAVGTISFLLMLVRIFLANRMSEVASKYFIMFMIVWWLIALVLLTFINPFTVVGNGYFATWGCALCSILLLN